jgi:cell division protein FtsI/penicillin-binding protein 2
MWRLRLISFLILFFSGVIILRLFYWQILSGERLKVLAENQYWQLLTIPAPRGEIFASDGYPLVLNETAYLVYVSPSQIENEKTAVFELAKILDLDRASISGRLKNDLVFVPLKHKVEEKKVSLLEELNLAGVGFRKEDRRFYPEGSMSAHLLGFVGSDAAGKDTGYFGIEGFYDTELSGRVGVLRQEKDASGRPILVGGWENLEAEKGYSLILTIDRAIQYMVEQKLKEAVERFGAKGGTVIILEPKTGEIIAMTSYPTYDPGSWQNFGEELFKNPAISDRYEPGSTFKIITMAAGLDTGLIEPDTICDKCQGPREIGGYTIRTWDNEYFPKTNMTKVLEHSDNVGAVFVAERLGLGRFYKYIKAFGFNETSGIDLQEEALANLRPEKNWRPIDVATASFGQGIAVTPIQMVRAVTAIANGGEIIQPFLVKKIVGKDREIEVKSKVIRRVIKPETAKVLTEMLVSAVDHGHGRVYKPVGYRIAGKTGTAQVPIAGHYDPHKTIASFIGFAPADDPSFVMLVRLTEPTVYPWGAGTAAPLFFEIAEELFVSLGIPPSH